VQLGYLGRGSERDRFDQAFWVPPVTNMATRTQTDPKQMGHPPAVSMTYNLVVLLPDWARDSLLFSLPYAESHC
jgi:hypothetical protein